MLLSTDFGRLLSGADLPRGHRRAEVEEPWMVSSEPNISPSLEVDVPFLDQTVQAFF